MPGVRGKIVAPELPEERVVLILRPTGLVVIRVVASKHVEVGVVGHAPMAAPCRGRSVTWRAKRKENFRGMAAARLVAEGQDHGGPQWARSSGQEKPFGCQILPSRYF